MAVQSLQERISAILAPAPEEPSVGISDMFPVDTVNISDLLRDYTMRTVAEVLLWVSAANTIDPEITGSYSYVGNVADDLTWRPANMYDVHSIRVSACTDFEVYFSHARIVYVIAGNEKTVSNEMMFHKGDFTLSQNGRQTGVVYGVW